MEITDIDSLNTDTINPARWQRSRNWLVGLALGVLMALFIWPATRWLVRSQVTLTVPVSSATAWNAILFSYSAASASSDALHRTAERHPDDYLTQLADALTNPLATSSLPSDVKITRLRELTKRFPNSPSLRATILRFSTQMQVRIYRDEETLVSSDTPSHNDLVGLVGNTPELLSAFDRDAAAGERLDPDNAYFPFIRAAGLFAAHRDDEALAAIQRAAQKPTWTEYYDDELAGEWQLQEEAFGQTGALPRTAYAFSIPFPHYSQLRSAGRMAVAKAIQAERAGNVAEGLAIRKAVRRCGSLMRVQERSLIGCLLGIAITQISLTRPGGAAAVPINEERTGEDRHQQLLREYDAYLSRAGRAQESAEAHAEIAAGVEARNIITQGTTHEPFGMAVPNLSRWWIADMLLLANALWMLALGGAAVLLERHHRLRSGQAMTGWARRGIVLSLMTVATLAGVAIFRNNLPDSGVWLAALLICGGLTLLLPGMGRADRLRSLGMYGLSFALVTLLCSAIGWQARSAIEPLSRVIINMLALEAEQAPSFLAQYLSTLVVTGAFAVPLLTLLTLSILSRIWRVPLSVGLIRGCRGCAVPFACILLLIYGVCIPFTLRQENAVDASLKRTVQHEGRYIAELTGKEWPGPTH